MRCFFVSLLLFVLPFGVAAAELPQFPDMDSSEEAAELSDELVPPAPLPKRLLQRPKTRGIQHYTAQQTAFDNLDPVKNVISDRLLDDDEPLHNGREVRQFQETESSYLSGNKIVHRIKGLFGKQPPDSSQHYYVQSAMTPNSTAGQIFYSGQDAEMMQPQVVTVPVPIMPTFGSSALDNLQLYFGSNTYKNALSQGRGDFGLNEGFNISAPFSMTGGGAVQFGIRSEQANLHDSFFRKDQTFVTAGVFKRFEGLGLQAGATYDWYNDRSSYGYFRGTEYAWNRQRRQFQQVRGELSLRTMSGLEYGFQCGQRVDKDAVLLTPEFFPPAHWAELQSYYLVFGRYTLPVGGQVEARIGATEWGDYLMSSTAQVALSDRLAVNTSIAVLSPKGGRQYEGGCKEAWSLSMGFVLYFRGGAGNFRSNLNRPMFDVAGNDSIFMTMKHW